MREIAAPTTAATNEGALWSNVGGESSLTELFYRGENSRLILPITRDGGREIRCLAALTNRSGASVSRGRFMVISTANATSVVNSTTLGNTAQGVVVEDTTIADVTLGMFVTRGIVNVIADAAVSIGDLIRGASTTGRVTTAASWLDGVLGIALTAAAGAGSTFDMYMFGATMRVGSTDPLTITTVAPATPVTQVRYNESFIVAWANKSGGATPALDDDLRISGLTDVGVGIVDFAIGPALANAEYAIGGCLELIGVSNSAGRQLLSRQTSNTTTNVRLETRSTGDDTAQDTHDFTFVIAGND